MMDRRKLAERIQALLLKTVERGCTEAEALAAAEKAQELLALYQISRTDLELEAEGFLHHKLTPNDYKRHGFPWRAALALVQGIAKFTDTRGWTIDGGRSGIAYAGLRSDIEFAAWLTDSLMQFALNAWNDYRLLDADLTHKPNKNEFYCGLTDGLHSRMMAAVAQRKPATTGRDLVVTKKPLIDNFVASLGIRFCRARSVAAFGRDSAAGARAADKAGFGRPTTFRSTPRIGAK